MATALVLNGHMDTKSKGELSEAKVVAKLMELGYTVSEPRGEYCRYDLIVDDGDLQRIQVKTGRVRDKCVRFNTSDTRSNRTGSRKRFYTKEDIEAFVVYCPDNNQFYWIPIEDAPKHEMRLRIEESDSVYGSYGNTNWAESYQI